MSQFSRFGKLEKVFGNHLLHLLLRTHVADVSVSENNFLDWEEFMDIVK